MKSEEIALRVEQTREDREHGATELAREALRLLSETAADHSISIDDFAGLFPKTARQLAGIRPSTASLLNAVGSAMAAWLEGGGRSGGDAAREAVAGAAERWIARQDADASVVADHAAEIISGVAVTLGYSSTVLRALEECWKRGVLHGVIVAESRPLFEGRRTAAVLAERGIPTVLITDAEIGVFASATQATVAGADSLMPSGYLVNTTGTNLLALAARRSRVPFYVLTETHRIAPTGRRKVPFTFEQREPEEVLPEPISGVAVRNVRLDMMTARYTTGYITEEGLLNRRDVAALARRAPGRIVMSNG